MNDELGGYVTELKLNTGEIIQLNKNDIVVFVGPNNCGKSQSLKDIFLCCKDSGATGVVVKDISLIASPKGIEELLPHVAVLNKTSFKTKNCWTCFTGRRRFFARSNSCPKLRHSYYHRS